MAKYLLDTGILLGFVRGAGYSKYVEQKFKLTDPGNILLVSAVSVGEMYSLAAQFQWGENKKNDLEDVLSEIQSIDISFPQILKKYAEIDAFSQGKHPVQELPPGMTARNMGKNDLWIAATASVLEATLLTTDKHFDHLGGAFLEVIYVDPHGRY
ncbi:MAG: type II toxin-antitoxin system VapC family toxin [Candidatus Aminicenantes bacterium]|nr:type II toxin-antitoxin system VapC family toxin [Candidatus Aminicenantes bacterium]